jgi:Spy/CpxP family protein refolding chaperone
MKFAVALFALTFVAQTFVPAFAQTTSDSVSEPVTVDAVATSLPLTQGTSINVLGGEGATRAKVQLSDQQKEKFYELKNKLLSEAGPKKLALAEQKRLLKDLLTQDNLDRKAVQQAQDKINSLHAELANVNIAFRMDMQQELTPEQRKMIRYRGLKSGVGKGRSHGRKMHNKRFPRASESQNDTIGSEKFNVENYAPANI